LWRSCASAEEFASKLRARAFSPDFLEAWDRFMEKYGFRCPLELDVATARFYETPERFYRQHEKLLLPEEILVARATDPGWTPLFLNAGGIILEVGGIFQHGALVAREYCKPCVAGIENATILLKDGQVVEMDGAMGVIRLM